MTIGTQTAATRLNSDKINEVIVNGGNARRVAPHRGALQAKDQTWRQFMREDKTALRDVLDPDSARYRSQFGYKFKDHAVPFIVDGLQYGRFALERINAAEIPYDRQQSDLAQYFMQAEDRIFFAGSSLTPAGGSTGFQNEGTTLGTNFTIGATTQLDLTTITTAISSLAAIHGEQADHFQEKTSAYAKVLVVSADVDDVINGFRDAVTGERMRPEILKMLAELGNGGAAIVRSTWLGATLDLGNGNLPIKSADGATSAALCMWSDTDPLYEVLTTGLIVDSGYDEVGNFTANLTQGYLPVSYDPYSIINMDTVDITP